MTALVWGVGKVKNRACRPAAGTGAGDRQALWKVRRPGCGLFHLDGRPIGELKSEWKRACKAAGFLDGRKAGGLRLPGHQAVRIDELRGPASRRRRAVHHESPDDVDAHAVQHHQESAQREALAVVDRLVEAGRG